MCYFQCEREREIEEQDLHALFIADLCTILKDIMRDMDFHVMLGMNTNDDVHDGSVSTVLADIGITEAVISNHKGKNVPVTCSKNKERKSINNI